jgi:hypothetical protein
MTNTLSTNKQIKKYVNHKYQRNAKFEGVEDNYLESNYTWRNKQMIQDKKMIQNMRHLLNKNNSLRKHKYVSEDDRLKLEKFLLLNNQFLKDKKKEKERKKNLELDEKTLEKKRIKELLLMTDMPSTTKSRLNESNRHKRQELRLKFYKDSK